MKNKKVTIMLVIILCLSCFLLSACQQNPRGILSIQKTSTNGLVDTYTVYYTDGTKTTFDVTNGTSGTDGTNGEDVTIEQIYQKYVAEYGEISYADFLSMYLTVENSDCSAVANCLLSSAKVYTQFTEISYVHRPMGSTSTTTETVVYTGSAVIYKIDEDNTYFLTNYHVVYDASSTTKTPQQIHCYLYGSESVPTAVSSTEYDYGEYAIFCELVGGSVEYDVAVLKANTADVLAINENVKAVQFADDYYVGQTAIAIGNPDDAGISVTKGIVSVDNEYIALNIDGTTREYRSIRMDTALYSGNSGGGLFNEKGQLIGLNNAGNGDEQNINYAIPVSIVKGVAENVLYHYKDGSQNTNGVYKVTLGITVTAEKSKYVYNEMKGYGNIVEDIILTAVESGSIADQLGLQIDDKLVSITIGNITYNLNRYFDIADKLLLLTVGQEVSFTYERQGEQFTTQCYTVASSDVVAVA